MQSTQDSSRFVESLLSKRIRDLVVEYPDTMPILAAHGLDLCCGGSHELGEALSLHGIDWKTVVPELVSVVESPKG